MVLRTKLEPVEPVSFRTKLANMLPCPHRPPARNRKAPSYFHQPLLLHRGASLGLVGIHHFENTHPSSDPPSSGMAQLDSPATRTGRPRPATRDPHTTRERCQGPCQLLRKVLLLGLRCERKTIAVMLTPDVSRTLVDFDWGVSPFSGDSDHFWREHPPNNGTGLLILGQH